MGLADLPVTEFLDRVSEHTPAPGGGGVAAVTTGLAAALAGMVARFSDAADPGRFSSDVAAADLLRTEVVGLADADAAAYAGYLTALRMPKEPDPQARRQAMAAAASAAADVPLAIVTAAAAIAELGARLAAEGAPRLRGDAATCALLAAAAARSAALLVEENLAGTPDDPRLAETGQLLDRAGAAAEQAAAAARNRG